MAKKVSIIQKAREHIAERFSHDMHNNLGKSLRQNGFLKKGYTDRDIMIAKERLDPAMRQLFEQKHKAMLDIVHGKKKFEEIQKFKPLFSAEEWNLLANIGSEIRFVKLSMEGDKKVRNTKAKERREKAKRMAKVCTDFAELGQMILDGKIKNLEMLEREAGKRGISRDYIWRSGPRYWLYHFEELLGSRRNQLIEEIKGYREKAKSKKFMDVDSELI